ncbi:hypothetical protein HY991_05245 [Candidatus Micrarchaeota archaeon]|nr:hypothetical protein [Candidatus Micrarchaeota archaeon]
MELRLIIREMLKKGLSPEEIKKNLVELGVENPDEVFKEAVEKIKPLELSKAGEPQKPKEETPLKSFEEELGLAEEEETEEIGKPLFGTISGRAEEKEKKEETPEKLEMISVSRGGKETVIGMGRNAGKSKEKELMEKSAGPLAETPARGELNEIKNRLYRLEDAVKKLAVMLEKTKGTISPTRRITSKKPKKKKTRKRK